MSKKVIVFTGHRDKVTTQEELANIGWKYSKHQGYTWRHGGAWGFDTQIDTFARQSEIEPEIYVPEYSLYGKKFAPLKRNMDMLNTGDVELLIACYDGRDYGGTLFTIQYAYKCNIPVIFVEAVDGT